MYQTYLLSYGNQERAESPLHVHVDTDKMQSFKTSLLLEADTS